MKSYKISVKVAFTLAGAACCGFIAQLFPKIFILIFESLLFDVINTNYNNFNNKYMHLK